MIKNFAEFVSESEMNEKKGDTYTKGCVMAYLDDLEPTVAGIQSKITEDELYEEEGDRTFGLENEPMSLYFGESIAMKFLKMKSWTRSKA
jgi:hypothetical protein